MTHFFATPGETTDWLDAEVQRIGLTIHIVELPAGAKRCFVWPKGSPPPGLVPGVLVDIPEEHGDTLAMGQTGWKGSAFNEPTASEGSRLHRQLTRSLRKLATVPLFAVSYDGRSRDEKPFAWGSPIAVRSGRVLRQWRGGGVTFEG